MDRVRTQVIRDDKQYKGAGIVGVVVTGESAVIGNQMWRITQRSRQRRVEVQNSQGHWKANQRKQAQGSRGVRCLTQAGGKRNQRSDTDRGKHQGTYKPGVYGR